MTRAHLLDSEDPLVSGQDYSALCGAKISKAEFVYFFDNDFLTPQFLPTRICRKCARLEIGKRYVYALIDGQEVRIDKSLAALNAPQPTKLSAAEWKAILEEEE